jgi:putative sterol carrier protein
LGSSCEYNIASFFWVHIFFKPVLEYIHYRKRCQTFSNLLLSLSLQLYLSKGNRDAENYYKNTQLEKGEIASNPRDLFMEAAAEYLGHRAVEYYSALDRLSRAANGEIPPDQL